MKWTTWTYSNPYRPQLHPHPWLRAISLYLPNQLRHPCHAITPLDQVLELGRNRGLIPMHPLPLVGGVLGICWELKPLTKEILGGQRVRLWSWGLAWDLSELGPEQEHNRHVKSTLSTKRIWSTLQTPYQSILHSLTRLERILTHIHEYVNCIPIRPHRIIFTNAYIVSTPHCIYIPLISLYFFIVTPRPHVVPFIILSLSLWVWLL